MQINVNTKMAKETIYLCNFRVSVDGDWLCLQELTDVELDTSIYCPSDDGSIFYSVILE